MDLLTGIAEVSLLSVFVLGFVEAFLRPIYEKVPALKDYTWTLVYFSLILGEAVAFATGINLFAQLSTHWIGTAITGGVIGKGAAFFWDALSKHDLTIVKSIRNG